jgi:hypothetical protein
MVDPRVDHFRTQAAACHTLGSPLYAALIDRLADDLESGGPTHEVLVGYEHDSGPSALALRLMGAVHRLVLEGDAPDLAAYYPSVGGEADADAAWPALRDLLARDRDRLVPLLDQAPQTNEVGRSAALLGGLLHIAREFRLPIWLHEIGASAGLNLRADHYRYVTGTADWGPPDSPVVLDDAWRGSSPPTDAKLNIIDREGSDLAPIDPGRRDGRLRLLSYVWPDQTTRLARLRGALEISERVPVTVRREDALSTVRRLALAPACVTVLWHSVMWQYLPRAERHAIDARLDALGSAATKRSVLARLTLEPQRRTPDAEHEFLVGLQCWPGERRILGVAAPHGVPTTWE